jgi:diphosphomevalonate decarboxylase
MKKISHITGRKAAWESPSNIAIIKYWGKLEGQIPANPSISMTLHKAYTRTCLEVTERKTEPGMVELEFRFEGKPNDKFREKLEKYLAGLLPDFPELAEVRLEAESMNTFPHSSGIASSASGMSAFALCLAEVMYGQSEAAMAGPHFLREASRLSRLASGSACRSVYGGFTVWGKHPEVTGSSDEYAIPLPTGINEDFLDLRDAILLVSRKEKSVSSRAGHSLMNGNPFAPERYKMAGRNASSLVHALAAGDWNRFVELTEMEALVLHSLMMSSNPSFILFEPNTIQIVKAIRSFRHETGIPVCFTLDAGPNVHLLYPGRHRQRVVDWIRSELSGSCQDHQWIDDEIGNGPKRIPNSCTSG